MTLILVIVGLVLRFGIDGYNTLGDLLIWLGVGLTLLVWVLVVFAGVKFSSFTRENYR